MASRVEDDTKHLSYRWLKWRFQSCPFFVPRNVAHVSSASRGLFRFVVLPRDLYIVFTVYVSYCNVAGWCSSWIRREYAILVGEKFAKIESNRGNRLKDSYETGGYRATRETLHQVV